MIDGSKEGFMQAAFYERTGSARDVLSITEFSTPVPGPGEVRVKGGLVGSEPVRYQDPRRDSKQEYAISTNYSP